MFWEGSFSNLMVTQYLSVAMNSWIWTTKRSLGFYSALWILPEVRRNNAHSLHRAQGYNKVNALVFPPVPKYLLESLFCSFSHSSECLRKGLVPLKSVYKDLAFFPQEKEKDNRLIKINFTKCCWFISFSRVPDRTSTWKQPSMALTCIANCL